MPFEDDADPGEPYEVNIPNPLPADVARKLGHERHLWHEAVAALEAFMAEMNGVLDRLSPEERKIGEQLMQDCKTLRIKLLREQQNQVVLNDFPALKTYRGFMKYVFGDDLGPWKKISPYIGELAAPATADPQHWVIGALRKLFGR